MSHLTQPHTRQFLFKRHLLTNTRSMAQISLKELPDLISKALADQANRLLSNIEHSQQFLSDKLDEFGAQIITLKAEIGKLKLENDSLRKALESISTKSDTVSNVVMKQELELDHQRRSELSSNAILLGIPRLPNENTKTLVDITCHTLGFNDGEKAIVSCTRLAKSKDQNSPIRIVFKNVHAKECLMARKKEFGVLTVSMITGIRWPNGWTNRVSIRDDLSPLSMELFRELKLQQPLLKFRYVWPGRHGVILVKFSENSRPIKVRSRCDLEKLISSSLN